MPPSRIDRLIVEVPGLPPLEARAFAHQLAARLAEAALPAAGDIPALEIAIAAEPPVNGSLLAERVLGALIGQLGRPA